MKKVKNALSLGLVLILCAAFLCACGSKASFDGKWSCVKIPSKMGFSEVKLNIDGDSFTYTLKGEETTTKMEGRCEKTDEESLTLYVEKQAQIHNGDDVVLNEKVIESSESESQPVEVKLDESGKLTLSGGTTKLEFERD